MSMPCNAFVQQIDAEFQLTAQMLQQVFAEPLAVRRPLQMAAMALRKAPLAVVHGHQIQLLRQWRRAKGTEGDEASATRLLGELFLTVNAIAGGIRNTG